MNKKRSRGHKPLLKHAFLLIARDDQDRFMVKTASVPELGDIHESVAEKFQAAVAERVFDKNPHIERIYFTPEAANDVLPHIEVERPRDPAAA